MVKFLITGYYGFLNSGDDAILTSMCEDIKSLEVDSKITILSKKPSITEEEYKTHSAYRFSFFSVVNEIRRTDVLLMGGGSLLQDATSTRSLIYYLSILGISKLFGKKCMIYANGIGPIKKPFNRLITKLMVNKVDIITLRESLSLSELNKMGITKPKIRITADPVFSLPVHEIDTNEILITEGIDTSKPYVAVLFRSWKDIDDYIGKTANICDYIVKDLDMNIIFIPMKYPTDLIISERIAGAMKENSYILKEKYDNNTIIQIIGKSKFILSMRLHALLYAALYNVPMIGFIYDPKVKYFLEEIKISTIEDITNFEIEDVEKHIDIIFNNYEKIQKTIEAEVSILKKKALDNRKYLLELVNMHLKKKLRS